MTFENAEDADVGELAPDPHRRRNLFIVLACLIAVALVAWLWARSGSSGARTGSSGNGRPTTTVGTAKVQRADMPLSLTVIGTAQPTVAATVRTQVAGVLRAIRFTEGQSVAKGQPLAQVDASAAQQAVAQARGTLAKDMAALNSARVDLVRYQTLWKQDSIAKQVLDTQAATVKQAEGAVAADRAAVAAAGVTLGYTTVRAPVSGRAGLRQTDLGSYVTPSDANGIVTITVESPMDVSFAVPQNQLTQVAHAARAMGGLRVSALDQSDGSVLGQGRFLTFDNAVDTSTGTIKGKARFLNGNGALVPNQFVNARIELGTLPQALIVPVSAVRHGPSGDFVFVLQPGNTVRLVNVTTGPGDGKNVVIARGLTGSETVITEGADKLDDGSPVTLAGQRRGAGTGQAGARRQAGAPGQ